MTTDDTTPTPERDERTGLFKLDEAECIEALEADSIGRIVFVEDGQPLALPVNYAWFEGSVVFRTGDGQKLQAATLGQRVAFEVDQIDPATHSGLSVLVKGTAASVEDWAEQEQLEQLDVRPWQRQPWRRAWIRITPTAITGRKLDVQ